MILISYVLHTRAIAPRSIQGRIGTASCKISPASRSDKTQHDTKYEYKCYMRLRRRRRGRRRTGNDVITVTATQIDTITTERKKRTEKK